MRWYKKRRQDMLNYLGNRCSYCLTTKNLEFDHINPKTKLFNIGENYSYAWKILVVELNKCQLLCEDCHKEKTNTSNIVHNRWRYMKHGCKCRVCKEDYSKYRKSRYSKEKGYI